MSADVLEPGEAIPVPLDEESVAVEPVAVMQFVRPICADCKRPLWLLNGVAVRRDDGSYMHDDARYDVEGSVGSHPAELFIEPTVQWGKLDTRGKSNFEVSPAPSARSGRGGGGVV